MMRLKTDPETTVRVARTFRAPLFRIYDAWTDPSMVSEWWGPFPGGSGDTHELIFEAKAYGEFHWVLNDASGNLHTINGEVREAVTREKLQFSWIESEGMPHFDQDDHHERGGRQRHLEGADHAESVVHIDFREGVGVEIRVLHTDLPDRATRDAIELGWESALERLDWYLQNGGKSPARSAATQVA